MKKTIAVLAVLCFLSLSLNAQDIIRMKNEWTGGYLNMETGTLQCTPITSDLLSAQWILMKIDDSRFQVKNASTGTFLNIEHGDLQCSTIEDDWISARWTFSNVPGTDQVRIESVWKPGLYINIENGAACSEIQDGWASARWKQELVGQNTAIENKQESTPVNSESAKFSLNIGEVVAAHNQLRSERGVPPLTWSDELAGKAQAWANELAKRNGGTEWHLDHSGPGENLAGGFVSGDSPAKRILAGWGDEKKNFDPNTRRCFGGTKCGHYTQVIWKNTTQLGCAVGVSANGRYILVCNYNPPGNFTGQPAY